MNSYRTFIFAAFTFGGWMLTSNTNTPEAMGFDPGSMWDKLSPLVLGVIGVILNDGDWPAWAKKIGNSFLKDKGADTEKGQELIDMYKKVIDLLAELKLIETEEGTRDDLKNVAYSLNRKMLDDE